MHMFKNVSFEDSVCSLCNKPHKSLECPSIIELEVTNTSQSEGNIKKYDRNYENLPTKHVHKNVKMMTDHS